MPNARKPTIVVVHGAWADGSSWEPVIRRLTGTSVRRDGGEVKGI